MLPTATLSAPAGRRLTVLIASHRPALAEALAGALRACGHEAVSHDTGDGVAEALRSPSVDVLVLDSGLPGVDWGRLRDGLAGAATAVAPESLEQAERRHIANTLRYTGGNRRNAARLLGIARSTLLAKIRRYGLERTPTAGRG